MITLLCTLSQRMNPVVLWGKNNFVQLLLTPACFSPKRLQPQRAETTDSVKILFGSWAHLQKLSKEGKQPSFFIY